MAGIKKTTRKKFKKASHNFKQNANNQILDIALDYWHEAKENIGLSLASDEIDAHYVYSLNECYEALKQSGSPLFSDHSYKPFGHTRDSFIQALTQGHIDCIGQCLTLAARKLHVGAPDEEGFELLERVENFHLPALGLEEIGKVLGFETGITQDDYEKITDAYDAWRFREKLGETIKNKISANDPTYLEGIVDSYAIIKDNPALLEDPKTFHGTIITLPLLKKEYNHACEHLLQHYINAPAQPEHDLSPAQCIENIEKLRGLMGEYTPPEPETIDDLRHDYWHRDSFVKAGYASYEDYVRRLKFHQAVDLIDEVTALARTEDALENPVKTNQIYETFLEAQKLFSELHVPFEDNRIMYENNIDTQEILKVISKFAAQKLSEFWQQAQSTAPAKIRWNALESMAIAIDYIQPDDYQSIVKADKAPDSQTLEESRIKITRRYAEELFADSLITLPDATGSFDVLNEAFNLMDEIESDILATGFMRAARGSQNIARQIDARYEALTIAAEWQSALDENRSIAERHDSFTYIHKRLPDLMENPAQYKTVLLHMDIESVEVFYEHYRENARTIIHNAIENLDLVFDDKSKETSYESIKILMDAVDVILPGASQSPISFKRITGQELKHIRPYFYRLNKWRELSMVPQSIPLATLADGPKIISYALDENTPGVDGYRALATYARRLRNEGQTILDSKMLEKLGLTALEFDTAVFTTALKAASQSIIEGNQKSGFEINFDNYKDHPFYNYLTALRHLAVVPIHTVLENDMYQMLGLPDRATFAEGLRHSLSDLLRQQEHLARFSHPSDTGFVRYFDLLAEINQNKSLLGLHTADDTARALKTIYTQGFDAGIMQRKWRLYGHDATKEVLNKAASLPQGTNRSKYQYAALLKLANFAENTLQIAGWSQKKDPKTGQSLSDVFGFVLRSRMMGAVNRYFRYSGTPLRGARLAMALKDLAQRHNVFGSEGFETMFQAHGYADFQSFAHERAEACICQLMHRHGARMDDANPNELSSVTPKAALDTLYEFNFIEEMMEEGLIERHKAEELMAANGYALENRRVIRAAAAALAAPILSAHVKDPLQNDHQRRQNAKKLDSVIKLSGMAPKDEEFILKPKDIKAAITQSALRTGALGLFWDMLSGLPNKVTPTMSGVADELIEASASLNSTQTLESLGLSPHEAAHYAKYAPYIVLHQLRNEINTTPDSEFSKLTKAVYMMCERAVDNDIRLDDENNLRIIGYATPDEFMQQFDVRAFGILRAITKNSQNETNYNTLREREEAIQSFLDMTMLDARYTPETFKTFGALDRDAIARKRRYAYLQHNRLITRTMPGLKPANS